jgi:hypothetical protein
MSPENSVQIIDTLLGTILIGKLWVSGLYKHYRVFWFFWLVNLMSSYAWLVMWIGISVFKLNGLKSIDYRIVWLSTSLPIWLLTVFMVYSHMEKILLNLPGIAKLSKSVLNFACISAVALGLISALIEYGAWGLWDTNKLWIGVTAGGIILARMFASIALLVFLAILTFLLWFPVSVSKNVASLTVGLLVYFASKTTLLLARGAWSESSVRLASTCISVISSLCFLYWIFQLTPKGESVPLALRLPWRNVDQQRLVRQLELLDQSLVQAARR